MGDFNYSDYFKVFTGINDKYRFANPDDAAKANQSDPNAAKKEYIKGLANTAKGRISVFDADSDKKFNFNEFKSEQEKIGKALGYQESDDNLKTEFGVLDLDGDGFVDSREIASELSLVDKADGKQDGQIGAEGWGGVYNPNNPPEKLKQVLQKNYESLNLANLDEFN